jgi:hypothetical protein
MRFAHADLEGLRSAAARIPRGMAGHKKWPAMGFAALPATTTDRCFQAENGELSKKRYYRDEEQILFGIAVLALNR